MTRTEALRKLQKLYGKRAAGQVTEGVTSPERRAAAQEEHRRLAAVVNEKAIHRKAVADAALAAAGVPALDEELKELRRQKDAAFGRVYSYRFRAGFIDNVIGAFNIQAQGDTWEEVFEELERKKAAGRL